MADFASGVFHIKEAGSPMTFYVLGGSMAITWAIERAGGVVCRDPPDTPLEIHPASAYAQKIIFNRDSLPTSLEATSTSETAILKAVKERGGWQTVLSSDWVFQCLAEGRLAEATPYRIKAAQLFSSTSSRSSPTLDHDDTTATSETEALPIATGAGADNSKNSPADTSSQRPTFSPFFGAGTGMSTANANTSTPAGSIAHATPRPSTIPIGPRSSSSSSTPLSGYTVTGNRQNGGRTVSSGFGPMRNQGNRNTQPRQRAGPGYQRPERAQAHQAYSGNHTATPYFVLPSPGIDPNVSLAATLLNQSLATLRAASNATTDRTNNAYAGIPLSQRISGLAQNHSQYGGENVMSIDDAVTLLAKRLAVWTRRLGRRPGKKVLKNYLTNVRIQGCPKPCKNVWIDHRHRVYAEMENQGINTAAWPLKLK
ncbi:hypothetical protein I316_06803 [Kwoniella heveanensis BCC8398]|uniref:BRCT domain-containing protein n=1 Tax=Kwoniella heveanensis BCC8398 TaxID=1296120 RepID=A0A1B9GKL3_9TREE|nr:hypothetical protein I316_06803 [Kwoniella heveanensis BCC8398]